MKKICICTTVSLTLKTFVVPTAEYLHQKCGYDITLICNPDKEFENSLPDYIHFLPVHMARGIDLSGFKAVIEFIKISSLVLLLGKNRIYCLVCPLLKNSSMDCFLPIIWIK